MTQTNKTNRQWILAERPEGEPTKDTLNLIEEAIPVASDNQMLLRTEFLSLDPYMRGRMSDAPSYAVPVEIGEVMVGSTVAQVVDSNIDGFAPGDYVLSFNGWQDYALSDGKGLTNLGKSPLHPSWALGILGMPGFTAWAGLKQIGEPKAGETIVVAAATGPVGATVGQIGKLMGCRVVGIAGGAEKCAYAVDELGFDACIDHKAGDFADQLAKASPDGIDVYFESVGGKVFDAVIPLFESESSDTALWTCVAIQRNCIASWAGSDELADGADPTQEDQAARLYHFDDFGYLYPDFAKEMGGWVESGKIKYREENIEGLENALHAFVGLLNGGRISANA